MPDSFRLLARSRLHEPSYATGPDEFFAGYQGTLLTDAYICYELLTTDSLGRIHPAGCHVHARRKPRPDKTAPDATLTLVRLLSCRDCVRKARQIFGEPFSSSRRLTHQ